MANDSDARRAASTGVGSSRTPTAAECERWAALHDIADSAVPITLQHFRETLDVENKLVREGGFDPVTIADREAERALRAAIAKRFPDDGILGEELGHRAGTNAYTWILDPIDGTRSFISGVPLWGTLIALSDEQGARLGVLDQPYLRERYMGGPAGSFLNGRPLRCRSCPELGGATLSTTSLALFSDEERPAFEAVEARVELSRHGYDCYAYAMLAHGFIDVVVESGLQAYDVQALIPIVEGAGGVLTNWRGEPVKQGGRVVACGDRRLHAEVLRVLSDHL